AELVLDPLLLRVVRDLVLRTTSHTHVQGDPNSRSYRAQRTGPSPRRSGARGGFQGRGQGGELTEVRVRILPSHASSMNTRSSPTRRSHARPTGARSPGRRSRDS